MFILNIVNSDQCGVWSPLSCGVESPICGVGFHLSCGVRFPNPTPNAIKY